MSTEDISNATPWFTGSVSSAVETANAKGIVLLVCLVQDGEEKIESRQFEGRFAEETFKAEFSNLDLVPLRLVQESPDGLMFGQIFPIMTVPALYLIRNGLLADFMNGSVDNDQMLERIKKAVQGHFQIPPPPGTVLPNVAGSSATEATEAATITENTASVSSPVVSSATSLSSSPALATSAPSTSEAIGSTSSAGAGPSILAQANAAPRAEQAQVLKDLMKERKVKREQEEREAAKQREINRRAGSKTLSEAQKDLADKQSKKLKDQIEKEKREAAEYKRKVKQDLEEDRARRRAEKEKAQAAIAASSAAYSSPSEASSSPFGDVEVVLPAEVRALNSGLREARNDAAPALAFDSSRLNIRLFDGSSIRNTFKATDTLEVVREWINQNQEGEDNAYNIVQLIPSRTFTDESKMLRDLELCPSATLVLKRTQTASSAYGSDGGAVPTIMGYGWSALGFAGKIASSALSTVAAYNPLSTATQSGSSSTAASSSSSGESSQTARTAASKKKDTEVNYNGNSTNLE